MQGKLFVIDGTNASGKKTQTKLLIDRMRAEGFPVETVAFPRYGEKSAGPVEDYLAGKYGTAKEVGPYRGSIFYAVDRYAASPEIWNWLKSGRNVVADRWVAANMGHQGCNFPTEEERREFFKWNDRLEHETFGIPRPDLTVILRVPAEVSVELMADRPELDMHEKDLEHQKRAEMTYVEMTRTLPGFYLIECTENGKMLTPEEIHEKLWKKIRHRLTW